MRMQPPLRPTLTKDIPPTNVLTPLNEKARYPLQTQTQTSINRLQDDALLFSATVDRTSSLYCRESISRLTMSNIGLRLNVFPVNVQMPERRVRHLLFRYTVPRRRLSSLQRLPSRCKRETTMSGLI